MLLQFTKMHGLGNDFMVIDAINQPVSLSAGQVRALADRHLGVGFDQLLLVAAASTPDADFRYRIFNADGGEVGQCGNGARCFMRFVQEQGLTDKPLIFTKCGLRWDDAPGPHHFDSETNDGEPVVINHNLTRDHLQLHHVIL